MHGYSPYHQYDPNRSARIALVQYEDGEYRYIIAPEGLKVGQVIASGSGVAPEIGNTLPLSEIPVGTLVHNIELRPGQGATMARSAGTFAHLAAREGKHAVLRLPSGETMVLVSCCHRRPFPTAITISRAPAKPVVHAILVADPVPAVLQ